MPQEIKIATPSAAHCSEVTIRTFVTSIVSKTKNQMLLRSAIVATDKREICVTVCYSKKESFYLQRMRQCLVPKIPVEKPNGRCHLVKKGKIKLKCMYIESSVEVIASNVLCNSLFNFGMGTVIFYLSAVRLSQIV